MDLLNARMILHSDFAIGRVDERIFGSALNSASPRTAELFDPCHPLSDETGFRTDVIDMVRALNLPWVRSPARTAPCGFRERLMEDVADLDGLTVWCRRGGAEPIRSIPLSDGCTELGAALVDYCNGSGDGEYARLRRRRGQDLPLGLHTWCLDGLPGEPVVRTLQKARVAADAMRARDPRLTLLLSLPAGGIMSPEVSDDLQRCIGEVDLVTLPAEAPEATPEADILVSERLNRRIDETARVVDRARAATGSRRSVHLAVEGSRLSRDPEVVGGLPRRPLLRSGLAINTLLRRVDRVRFACASDLASVLRPMLSGQEQRVGIGTPMLYASIYGRGMSLMPAVECPLLSTREEGDIPCLDVASVTSRGRSSLSLFVVNRHPNSSCMVTLAMRGFGQMVVSETVVLHDDGPGRGSIMVQQQRGTDPVAVFAPMTVNLLRLVRAAA